MKIILYVKTGCPWCKGVLDLFKSNNVSFEERNVTSNKAYFDEMVKKSGKSKAPTLDIDGEILGDSDVDQVKEYFAKKGVVLA
jgi:glutaredoxin